MLLLPSFPPLRLDASQSIIVISTYYVQSLCRMCTDIVQSMYSISTEFAVYVYVYVIVRVISKKMCTHFLAVKEKIGISEVMNGVINSDTM